MATVAVVVDIDSSKGDVGDLAKAAADAETPHRAKGAPTVALILPGGGLKKGDDAKLAEALEGVKGVDAKASSVRGKAVIVKLDDKGGAKLADIKKALAKVTKAE
jgi:hypothetical protein